MEADQTQEWSKPSATSMWPLSPSATQCAWRLDNKHWPWCYACRCSTPTLDLTVSHICTSRWPALVKLLLTAFSWNTNQCTLKRRTWLHMALTGWNECENNTDKSLAATDFHAYLDQWQPAALCYNYQQCRLLFYKKLQHFYYSIINGLCSQLEMK